MVKGGIFALMVWDRNEFQVMKSEGLKLRELGQSKRDHWREDQEITRPGG